MGDDRHVKTKVFADLNSDETTRRAAVKRNEDANTKFSLEHKPSKKFTNYDSLRYECERLDTFISWPLDWLHPANLAADGFYYLRTEDHCACVFCRGIVGAWERGDTPRAEHKRHFPHCPFVRGHAVGNIPLAQSEILYRLPNHYQPPTTTPAPPALGVDVCGHTVSAPARCMTGSYAENSPPSVLKRQLSIGEMGLPLYSGPKRKDFLTPEKRLESYTKWPKNLSQTPAALAEAGFYYCGLSDHVRCYHCGNGLRNWESEDDPWEEHARWYSDCSFLQLRKGQEFIDEVRRKKPPFERIAKDEMNVVTNSGSDLCLIKIGETELSRLMELDIMRAVVAMGFPEPTVRATLRQKLEQTGTPYFGLEPAIEAVLQYMEEETRKTLQDARINHGDVQEESAVQQMAKLQSMMAAQTVLTGMTTPAEDVPPAPRGAHLALSATQLASISPIPSTQVANSFSLPPMPPSSQGSNSEMMETEENTVVTTVVVVSSPNSEPMEVNASERNQFVTEVPKDLSPPVSFVGSPSSCLTVSTEGQFQGSGGSGTNSPCSSQSSVHILKEELTRLREQRTCKVCMDAEICVVFLPCQHMVVCSMCATALTTCPLCRADIKYAVKAIIS